MSTAYYFANGIIKTKIPSELNDIFYVSYTENKEYECIAYDGKEIFGDIEAIINSIIEQVTNKIFNEYGFEEYQRIISTMPSVFRTAGIDSDCPLGNNDFSGLIEELKQSKGGDNQIINRAIYVADFESVAASLQNTLQCIMHSFENFYIHFCKTLPNAPSPLLQKLDDDRMIWVSGGSTHKCFMDIFNIFTFLYSAFDIVTKILYEVCNLNTDFSCYQKLQSSNVLFGSGKHLMLDKKSTIYEANTEYINLVRGIRNDILHNFGWEQTNKVFIYCNSVGVKEKFILLPDHSNGNFDKLGNRNRFYSRQIKLNMLLSEIVFSVLLRIKTTLIAALK